MGIRYYNAGQSRPRTQGKRKRAPHVKMSKEARALLNIRRRSVATQFHKEIDEVHDYILKSSSAIAEKHGKSLRNIQSNVSGGRGSLTRPSHNKTSPWNAWVHEQSKGRKNGGFLFINLLVCHCLTLLLFFTSWAGERSVGGGG